MSPKSTLAHRFLTIDRQRDHFWAVLRAWRADGSSMLLFCGRLLEWSQIPALEQKYKIPKPACVLLDAGFDPSAEHGYTCLRGEGRPGAGEYIHRDGRKVEKKFFSPIEYVNANQRRVKLFRWSNTPVKDILGRLRGSASFEIPADTPAEYQQHMTAEHKRDIINKVTGEVTAKWVRIGDRQNHFSTVRRCR